MIRTNEILAEPNAANTVISTEILNNDKIVGGVNKSVVKVNNLGNGLLITNSLGNIAVTAFGLDRKNKILVTDENGDLQWIGG